MLLSTFLRSADSSVAWIDSFDNGEDPPDVATPTERLLAPPSRAHAAKHHYAPIQQSRRISRDGFVETYDDALIEKRHETGFFGGHREPVKGRKWDHARDSDPVIMQSGVLPRSSPWIHYIRSSTYGPAPYQDGKKVDEEFLQHQTPGYEKPWRGDMNDNEDTEKLAGLLHSKKQRRTLVNRLQVRTGVNLSTGD